MNYFFRCGRIVPFVAGFFCIAMLAGCDDDDDDSTKLSDRVPDPVAISLVGDLGQIDFDFGDSPVRENDTAEMRALLTDGSIELIVESATGVSHDLTSGDLTTDLPTEAGQYQVWTTDEGVLVRVVFFNEFNGASISADKGYTAAITVKSNDYFDAEVFTRNVDVTE